MHSIPWYQRLSVRLPAALVVALLSFNFISDSIYSRALDLLGIAPPVDGFILRDAAQEEEDARSGARVVFEAATAEHFDIAARALAAGLRPDAAGFVTVDEANRITYASPGLDYAVGAPWPHGPESHRDVQVPAAASTVAHLVYGVVEESSGGSRVAFLEFHDEVLEGIPWCNHGFDAFYAKIAGQWVFADAEASDQAVVETNRTIRFLNLAVSVLVAGLLALLLSRRVTRRISSLSKIAAQPVRGDGTVPGPFDAAGSDEISRLAAAMNTRREEILTLLSTLARQDASRRDWIAQVSHDLRTPLTALMSCLERARGRLGELDEAVVRERVGELVDIAKIDAERVHDLAEDLLEIARLEAREDLSLEWVPVGELVRKAVRGLRPLAEGKGVELGARVEPRLPDQHADGRRLMRALENLLKNATQHAKSRVDVDVRITDDMLCLEVSDDGPGFAHRSGKVNLGKLARESRASAGLGLQVARKVAQAHGGWLAAANRQSGGARVWINLPLTSDASLEKRENADPRERESA